MTSELPKNNSQPVDFTSVQWKADDFKTRDLSIDSENKISFTGIIAATESLGKETPAKLTRRQKLEQKTKKLLSKIKAAPAPATTPASPTKNEPVLETAKKMREVAGNILEEEKKKPELKTQIKHLKNLHHNLNEYKTYLSSLPESEKPQDEELQKHKNLLSEIELQIEKASAQLKNEIEQKFIKHVLTTLQREENSKERIEILEKILNGVEEKEKSAVSDEGSTKEAIPESNTLKQIIEDALEKEKSISELETKIADNRKTQDKIEARLQKPTVWWEKMARWLETRIKAGAQIGPLYKTRKEAKSVLEKLIDKDSNLLSDIKEKVQERDTILSPKKQEETAQEGVKPATAAEEQNNIYLEAVSENVINADRKKILYHFMNLLMPSASKSDYENLETEVGKLYRIFDLILPSSNVIKSTEIDAKQEELKINLKSDVVEGIVEDFMAEGYTIAGLSLKITNPIIFKLKQKNNQIATSKETSFVVDINPTDFKNKTKATVIKLFMKTKNKSFDFPFTISTLIIKNPDKHSESITISAVVNNSNKEPVVEEVLEKKADEKDICDKKSLTDISAGLAILDGRSVAWKKAGT